MPFGHVIEVIRSLICVHLQVYTSFVNRFVYVFLVHSVLFSWEIELRGN